MQDEADITVNGTRLSDNESRMVRLAMASFADILTDKLGFKDDGIALTDRYLVDVVRVRSLIDDKARRPQ